MHIAFVTTTYPPDTGWGGIGTYVFHMARGLAQRGHRVTVLCGFRDKEYEREDCGLRIVRRIRTEGVTALERSEQISQLLEQEIPRNSVDVLEFGEYGGDGAVFQRRNREFPVVVKVHCPTRLCAMAEGALWQRLIRRHFLRKAGRLAEQLEQESVARAHTVVSPSQWMMQILRQEGWPLPAKRAVVPNPFGGWPDVPRAQPRDYAALEVVVLGRVARIKGADLLPEVFSHVWREVPASRFELIGQDSGRTRRESWQKTILRKTPERFRANLLFRGGIPYAELPQCLGRHSVAMFASRVESLCYATMECMWAGMACVVASQGGAQELGENGVSAFNTPRQPEAIAHHLVRLLLDPDLRRRMGEAARRRIDSNFSVQLIAQRMEAIYEQTLARSHPNEFGMD